jgi:hypothetical protein
MLTNPVASIDQHAKTQFLRGLWQPLTAPDALVTEASPHTAIGYLFSWGYILERRFNQFVLWDYCLTHYLPAGYRLDEIQRQVFTCVAEKFTCTSRDLMAWLSLESAWMLCPCSAVGLFSHLVHYASEQQAREWVVHELLTVLPAVIVDAHQAIRLRET